MLSEDANMISAAIRVIRSISVSDELDDLIQTTFFSEMISKEFIEVYVEILRAEWSEKSIKLKFELAWFLINLTALEWFK